MRWHPGEEIDPPQIPTPPSASHPLAYTGKHLAKDRQRESGMKSVLATFDPLVGGDSRHQRQRQGHAAQAGADHMPVPATLNHGNSRSQFERSGVLDP